MSRKKTAIEMLDKEIKSSIKQLSKLCPICKMYLTDYIKDLQQIKKELT